MFMNSVLTMEEKTLLQSLGCNDKAQALAVLEELKMDVPIRSELFQVVVALIRKLEGGKGGFWLGDEV